MGSLGTQTQKMGTIENRLAPWFLPGFFGFLWWILGSFWSKVGSLDIFRENGFRTFWSFSYVYETVQWVSIRLCCCKKLKYSSALVPLGHVGDTFDWWWSTALSMLGGELRKHDVIVGWCCLTWQWGREWFNDVMIFADWPYYDLLSQWL